MKPTSQPKALSLLIVACLAFRASASVAQQPTTPDEKPAATFDAISIKPSDRPLESGGAWGINRNTYSARNIPLAYIILAAYFGGTPSSKDRILNAPSWVFDQPWFITAKADDATANAWKGLRQSLQVNIAQPLILAMLKDRCHLVAHTVPTQIQGYALVLGKHPLKLKPYDPNQPLPKSFGRFEGGWMIAYSDPGAETQPFTSFLNVNMTQFTEFISLNGGPILDQTGLTGSYDFKLPRFDPIPPPPSEPGAQALRPAMLDSAHAFDFQAVGLELKTIQVPSFNIVIDHIQQPTPN